MQALEPLGNGYASLRATLYARCPESLDSGQLQLKRVATYCGTQHMRQARGASSAADGVPSRACGDEDPDDDVLLLRASDESLLGLATSAEESLVAAGSLTLPASGSVVLPLAEGPFLVGLLVVEHASGTPAASSTVGSAVAGGDGSVSEVVGGEAPTLSAAELRCCRGAARPLAKACAMALRAALTSAQQAARNMLSRRLLDEVKGPLRALQTFSSMLAPRLPQGDLDKDMADGIVLQGQRLQARLQHMLAHFLLCCQCFLRSVAAISLFHKPSKARLEKL